MSDNPNPDSGFAGKIEYKVVVPSIAFLVIIGVLFFLYPVGSSKQIGFLNTWATTKLGWLYLLFASGCLIFLLYAAMSKKYGDIRFGGPDAKPDFSTYSWIGMLITAGLGSSIMFWGSIEWAHYVVGPPFGVEPGSPESYLWASSYGLFHWGPSAWAIYCIPTLPIAYAYWNRKRPILKLSTACEGVIGQKHSEGFWGKLIDIFFVVGIIGGCGTSIGLGTPMISTGLNILFGIPKTFTTDLMIIIVWVVVFGGACYIGVEKGIKRLSDLNFTSAQIFLGIIFILGPSAFIVNNLTEGIGTMFQNYFRMSLTTDVIGDGGFPQGWTVFYWAWWLVVAPTMGLWVARISKGRTVREVVLAEIIICSVGCWLMYGVLGNYGMYLDLKGIEPISKIAMEEGNYAAIATMMLHLPAGKIFLFFFCAIMFLFLATTIDAVAMTLAMATSRNLRLNEDPPPMYRIFWVAALVVLPLALMFIGYQMQQNTTEKLPSLLRILQASSQITSPPLMVIFTIMTVSFVKWVRQDKPIAGVNYEGPASEAPKAAAEPAK
ncbi:BCCT family transporter [Deltaproteobacteria bacterium OttesenSCG-928-M10]|nr:BCCT family transporter [Deltaproteobacteria bacterium OttesenSCG-928-M10]